jgi:ABC-type hemin transport system substrate-binding protein
VAALRAAGLEVLVTGPDTVEGALDMIADIGRLLGCDERAAGLVTATRAELALPLPLPRPRVFVAVWWEPLLGLGGEAYGSDLVERAGAVNVLRERPRYPEVTLDEVAALQPGLVLLPDEPYRFRPRHSGAFAPIAPARVVDGKALWWYGPRMPRALRDLRGLFANVREQAGGRQPPP